MLTIARRFVQADAHGLFDTQPGRTPREAAERALFKVLEEDGDVVLAKDQLSGQFALIGRMVDGLIYIVETGPP